jgi:drug/metabolite transporter (DMT)-like permease
VNLLAQYGFEQTSATRDQYTLETPLAVAWVWVCFNEAPSGANLAGGIIVMVAVVGHVWHSNRSRLVPATG